MTRSTCTCKRRTLSFGSAAAAAGTNGNRISGPHSPMAAVSAAVCTVPRTLISAAEVQAPRPPASVRHVSRTALAGWAANVAVFSLCSLPLDQR